MKELKIHGTGKGQTLWDQVSGECLERKNGDVEKWSFSCNGKSIDVLAVISNKPWEKVVQILKCTHRHLIMLTWIVFLTLLFLIFIKNLRSLKTRLAAWFYNGSEIIEHILEM